MMSIRQDREPVPLREAIAELLELSGERDRYLARILAAWREGYAAGELAHADDYERGIHDGIVGYKKATRDIMEMARLQIRRYGPHSRQFTDPRSDDFPGELLRGYPRQDGAA